MGKTPSVSWNAKFNALKRVNIFNEDGSLKKETHPAWQEAHAKLRKLDKKSIYYDVLKNRNNIKTDLLQYNVKKKKVQLKVDTEKYAAKHVDVSKDNKKSYEHRQYSLEKNAPDEDKNDIAKLKEIINSHENSKSHQTFESDVSCEDSFDPIESESFCPQQILKHPNPQNFPVFDFVLTLNEREWRLMKPVNNKLPKYEWTSVIAAKIYDETPLRCAYIFKVGKVYTTLQDKYIDFYAYCKQNNCQTYMYGLCKQKPVTDTDGIQFCISTYNTTSLYHKTKRPFMSSRRKEGGKKLVYMSAEHFRNEMVHDLMNFSEDQERPDIPSGANLRTVKLEGLRTYLGISGPKDPLKCLIYMMDEFNFIREVCLKPFRVWYCFGNQIDLWDSLATLNPVLKLDATGSLIKKVSVNEEPCAYIYLYQLITTVGNNYAPLNQMLSSRHDTNAINNWLNAWKAKVRFLPKEAICDEGLALLYALCITLNDCTWKYYLSVCLLISLGFKGLPALKCFIGIDRAHVTKAPTNWKAVKAKNDKTFTDFIIRSIALASISETLEQVKEVLLATLIICLSETMEANSVCNEKYEWLMNQFEQFDINTREVDNEKKNDGDEDVVVELDKNTQEEINLHMDSNIVKTYVESIKDKALQLTEKEKTPLTDQNKNEFFCKDVVHNLLFLYSQFPAWTNLMRSYFQSQNKVATSAEVEAYFKDLRNTFNLKNVLAPHTFVMYHARIVDAQTKIAKCRLMQILNETENSIVEQEISKLESEISSILCETKNIMTSESVEDKLLKPDVVENMSIDEKVEKNEYKIQELLKCDVQNANTKSVISNPNEKKFHAHLRNGHLDEKVVLNGREIEFANTCAFDSLFAILSFAYENNSIFKEYVDENIAANGLFFGSIAGYSNRTMNMKQFYENRGTLLLDNFTEKNATSYDCRANVDVLLWILLKHQFSCRKIVRCRKCKYRRVEEQLSLIVNDVFVENLIDAGCQNIIHESIINLFDEETLFCRKCRNDPPTAFGRSSLGSFLAVDISKVFEDNGLSSVHIPKTLFIQETTLTLAGFVVRQPPAEEGGLAHYIAYCYDRFRDTFEIKDDTQTSSTFKKTPRNVKICTMIYVLTDL